MKNKILSIIFILSLILLPSNVALAGGGSFTSFGSLLKTVVQIAATVAVVYVVMSIPSPQWLSSYVTVGSFTPPLVTAVQTFAGNILLVGEVLCGLEQNNPVKTGCNDSSNNNAGSGNSSSSGSGANTSQATNVTDGKVGGCSSGNKLCGTNSCIPAEATCCQSVGLSGYCPAGNVCTRDGICEVATADNTTCSNLQGTKCISPANSCGQTNASSYKCDGSCTVFAAPDSGCASPDITLTVPSFVEYGKECLITSKVNNATSCSIDGTNVTVPNGTYKTPPIVATANFTMVCKNGSVVTASKTVTCRINPTYQEF